MLKSSFEYRNADWILSILLQRNVVTTPYFEEQFEVSRRRINRDIENLCKAGITEMQDILAGLRRLDSINGTTRYGKRMEKLSAGSSDFMVEKSKTLEFTCYFPKAESVRCIEPYYPIFRWSSCMYGMVQKAERFSAAYMAG